MLYQPTPLGAQLGGNEVGCERLANGAEYALVQAVDQEQGGDNGDILR